MSGQENTKYSFDEAYVPCGEGSITPTKIGGQAVIEGVMMRGKYNWVVTARDAEGELHYEEHDLDRAGKKKWLGYPIIRGVVALVDSLVLGTKALAISASLAGVEEEGEEELSSSAIAGSILVGGIGAVVLFIMLPAWITNLMIGPATQDPLLWNIVDGVWRALAFFAYVFLIGFVPDIKRVFMYHGAEHKVIHTFEHGEELSVENARKYPTLHLRCGTAFLLMVMLLSIVVFSLIPIKAIVSSLGVTNNALVLGIVILSRIILMPLVAGLAYEVTVKWASAHADMWLVKIMLSPGLQLQRLTTKEPSDDMLEVAINSMKLVVEREAAEETANPNLVHT